MEDTNATPLPGTNSVGAADAAPEAVVRLSVTRGPMAGKEFVFNEHETFLFGRSQKCQACIPDDTFVSRYHFILEIDPPRVCLQDLGSMNGTLVNNTRYGGESRPLPTGYDSRAHNQIAVLGNGDVIQVGETLFRVAMEGAGSEQKEHCCDECGRDLGHEPGAWLDGRLLCGVCQATVVGGTSQPSEDGAASTVLHQTTAPPSIAGYTIDKKIGQGGMGTVYLAAKTGTRERVAVKVLRPKVVVDPYQRAVFLREMELMEGLRHPNIVAFLGGGEQNGGFYFAMEYCEGGSVEQLLKSANGPLPLRIAGPIMLQVLKGLAHAHERDLVHRDLKPQNLLLHGPSHRRTVKISDFGLAKNFSKAGLSGMTVTGTYGGTFAFMPREQITDYKYVRPSCDVWSVAATFYAMLTGVPPRDMPSGQRALDVILTKSAVPLEKRNPAIPAGVAAVINKALQDDPTARYQSAGEFRAALKESATRR